jgi:hypothetical protein
MGGLPTAPLSLEAKRKGPDISRTSFILSFEQDKNPHAKAWVSASSFPNPTFLVRFRRFRDSQQMPQTEPAARRLDSATAQIHRQENAPIGVFRFLRSSE